MYPNHVRVSILLAACVLFWQPAAAQKNAAADVVANFEKDLDLGRVSQVETPLFNYALANPNNLRALELLARLRGMQGRLDEARALYDRLLTLDPASVPAKMGKARIAYSQGQIEDARNILASIVQTSSMKPATLLELASAFYAVGELAKASAAVDALPAVLKNGKALPLTAAVYLASGRMEELGRLIPLMNSPSAADPATVIQNAEVLQNAGLTKDAFDLLRAALKKKGNNAGLLLALARLEISTRDFVGARAHLKSAAVLAPRSAEIISAQAMLENAQGNNAAAFDLLAKARQIDPDSSKVLADFAVLALRSGKPNAAFDAAKILLSREPENAEYEYLVGAASLQSGDLKTASESLDRFMQKRPKDPRGCLALGLVLAAQPERVEDARRQLRGCVETDPTNFEARYQLGLSYKAQGENDKAVAELEATIKAAPEYAPALRDLGTLYLQAGDDARARGTLEHAAAIDPRDGDTHFQLSRLYNRIGEPALAKQQLELFQKLKNSGGRSAQ